MVGEVGRHDAGDGRDNGTGRFDVGEQLYVVDRMEDLMRGGVGCVLAAGRIAGDSTVLVLTGRQLDLAYVVDLMRKPCTVKTKYHQTRQKDDEHEQRGLTENGL